MNHLNVTAGLTVGSEERRREEAFVHQTRERNDADHVVGVKAQAAEGLAVQPLWEDNRRIKQVARQCEWWNNTVSLEKSLS